MQLIVQCNPPPRHIFDWCNLYSGVTYSLKNTVLVRLSLNDWSSHCRSHRSRPFDQVLQPGVAELQANDVVEFLSFWWRRLIVASPLSHWHLDAFLGVHVHDIHNASTTCKRVWRSFTSESAAIQIKHSRVSYNMMHSLPTHKLTSLTLKSGSGILQEGGNYL